MSEPVERECARRRARAQPSPRGGSGLRAFSSALGKALRIGCPGCQCKRSSASSFLPRRSCHSLMALVLIDPDFMGALAFSLFRRFIVLPSTRVFPAVFMHALLSPRHFLRVLALRAPVSLHPSQFPHATPSLQSVTPSPSSARCSISRGGSSTPAAPSWYSRACMVLPLERRTQARNQVKNCIE